MEKDKLMELINSMINDRAKTKKTLEEQRVNAITKGLKIIEECLIYGKEMEQYFRKLKQDVRQFYTNLKLGNYHTISWLWTNEKKFAFYINNNFFDSSFYLEDIQKAFSKVEEIKNTYLGLGALELANSNYNVEDFISKVNEFLADSIIKYQEETKKLKSNLNKE